MKALTDHEVRTISGGRIDDPSYDLPPDPEITPSKPRPLPYDPGWPMLPVVLP